VVAGPAVSDTAGASPGPSSIELAVDLAGGTFGRGAHVHPSRECLAKAARGGFSRAFKTKVTIDPVALAKQIVDASERRIAGLVVGARRAQRLAVGADAAFEALASGAPLLLVACDAGGVGRSTEVSGAVAEGRAIVLLTKSALGALLGRDEVAIAAVKTDGIADEIRRVYFMADAVRGQRGGVLEV
jgi:predicted RNA-binding protein YlxR (DUF448 family)